MFQDKFLVFNMVVRFQMLLPKFTGRNSRTTIKYVQNYSLKSWISSDIFENSFFPIHIAVSKGWLYDRLASLKGIGLASLSSKSKFVSSSASDFDRPWKSGVGESSKDRERSRGLES